MNKVVVYTKDNCPYCDRAKDLLKRKNIAFEEIHLSSDRFEEIEALMKRTNHRTVPQIFIGEMFVGGFNELNELDHKGELEKLL